MLVMLAVKNPQHFCDLSACLSNVGGNKPVCVTWGSLGGLNCQLFHLVKFGQLVC